MTVSALFTLNDAAKYLKANLSDQRSENYWNKYLKENPLKYLKQHGLRLSSQVVEGELYFTESTLKAFIKLMGSSVARNEANATLRAIDRKEMSKRSKFPKTVDWQFNKKNNLKSA